MTYKEAKKQVFIRRAFGMTLALLFLVVTLTSLMKALYAIPDGGFLQNIIFVMKNIIGLIYHKVPIIPFFWQYSPKVDILNLISTFNVNFFVCYLITLLGIFIFHSGSGISSRLKRIDKEIEDETIRESMRPGPKRTAREIRESVEVPAPSILTTIHSTYIGPLVVTVIGAFIAFLFGWN